MKGGPLPPETQDYIAKLAPMIGVQQGEDQKGVAFDHFAWVPPALFPSHAASSSGAVMLAVRARPDHSPAVRRAVDLSALAPNTDGLFVRLASEAGSSRWHRTPSHDRRAYRRFGIERSRSQGRRPRTAREKAGLRRVLCGWLDRTIRQRHRHPVLALAPFSPTKSMAEAPSGRRTPGFSPMTTCDDDQHVRPERVQHVNRGGKRP